VLKEYERCLKCGKKLKNPTARQIGLGSTCAKKVIQAGLKSTAQKRGNKELSHHKLFDIDVEDKDTGSDIDD
jgi:hypothetical protein